MQTGKILWKFKQGLGPGNGFLGILGLDQVNTCPEPRTWT